MLVLAEVPRLTGLDQCQSHAAQIRIVCQTHAARGARNFDMSNPRHPPGGVGTLLYILGQKRQLHLVESSMMRPLEGQKISSGTIDYNANGQS